MAWKSGRSVSDRIVQKGRGDRRQLRRLVSDSKKTDSRKSFQNNFSTYSLWDDFEIESTETGEVGRLGWTSANVGDGGGSVAALTPTVSTWADCGLIKLSTAGTTGNGIVLHKGTGTSCPFYGPPPAGSNLTVKLGLDGTLTQVNIWAGLSSAGATIPDTALENTVHFIGVVASATSTAVNWFGLCRAGRTETSVDLGVAADTSLRTLGWKKTKSGVQFQVNRASVGTEVTTNIPAATQALAPAIGIGPASGSARKLVVDFYGLYASIKRFG